MTDRGSDDDWRDFKFTVDVILASALAREDVAALSVAAPRATHGALHFKLLAAAATEEPALPAGEWHDTHNQVSTSVSPNVDELRATFQAMGYAAMVRYGGKSARMMSLDGEIEIAFRFDVGGRGIAVLADRPAVRRALGDFVIVLD